MLLWTFSALVFRVLLSVSSGGQLSPVLRLSGILIPLAFLHPPQYLEQCCMSALNILFILRRNPLSGQKRPRLKSPRLILTQTQGFKWNQEHPKKYYQVNSDILGIAELPFPFECALSVYIIPRHLLGLPCSQAAPRAFKGPEEIDHGNLSGKYPCGPLMRLMQN